MTTRLQARREGFSLVEVIIAMLILTVGILAMAALSAFVTTQIRVAQVRGERVAAMQQQIEQIRATPFFELDAVSQADAATVGAFTVWWEVDLPNAALARIALYTEGPGFAGGAWSVSVRDTFVFSISRPDSP
jgi:Tfp pilus assembly protein PilV